MHTGEMPLIRMRSNESNNVLETSDDECPSIVSVMWSIEFENRHSEKRAMVLDSRLKLCLIGNLNCMTFHCYTCIHSING